MPAGRRVLPLCQTVNFVIEQEHLAVEIPAQQVSRMIAANRQAVAIAGDDPHIEIGIGEFDARGHRRRSAVNRMVPIGFDIIGEAAGTADP